MSKIGSVSVEVDSVAGPAGEVVSVRRAGDTFGAHYNQYLAPYVFGYTENNRDPVLPCAGDWIMGDAQNTAVVVVEFLDQNYGVISEPVLLPETFCVVLGGAYMRVVGVLSAGHFRYTYGSGPMPTATPLNFTNQQGMSFQMADVATWAEMDPVPVCDLSGVTLSVAPYQCGFGGLFSSLRAFDQAANYTASHWDVLMWGFGTLDSDPELLGTVTGGLYIREFIPILSGNGAITGSRVQPWQYPCVLHKRSAAGVSAGATVPVRNFQAMMSRLYVRSSKLFQKG